MGVESAVTMRPPQVWVDEVEEKEDDLTHLVCWTCFTRDRNAQWSLCGAWEEGPNVRFSDISPDDCPDCIKVAKDPCYRCGGDTGW